MRFLAIDLGERRTGLAVGDDVTGVVSPAGILEIPRARREGDLLDALSRAVAEHGPDAVVIGLPLNMDGTPGPQAELVRRFSEKLGERIAPPLHFQDERLTSFAAEKRLDRSGRTHGEKKMLRDALAAASILEDFLAARDRNRAPKPARDRNG